MFIRPWVRYTLVVCAAAAPTVVLAPRAGSSPSWMERGGPGVFNHPTGVRPSRSMHVPAGWPLGRDGTLNCFTCHVGIPATPTDGPGSLRGRRAADEGGLDFCAHCHAEGQGAGASSMHWRAIGVAHLTPDGAAGSGTSAGELDAESRLCLSCHDGVTAPDALNPGSRHGSASFGEADRNHSIGVPYPRSTPRGSEVRFRSPALLPAQVRLPGGSVGCVSCHNVYAPGPARLTVPIEGSALCMTCHEMD